MLYATAPIIDFFPFEFPDFLRRSEHQTIHSGTVWALEKLVSFMECWPSTKA